MKKSTITMNRKFVFNCSGDAQSVLNGAKEFAELYGYVTVANMCDLTGMTPIYTENLVGWTPKAIDKAYVYKEAYAYLLNLPQCDWEKYGHTKEDENTKKSNTGEPINITISSNEWDTRRNDIEQVINELFKNSDKIKDHPVFINIM